MSISSAVARGVYDLATCLGLPLILPLYAFHPRLRGGLGQRLGAGLPRLKERPVWLHGASAGDLKALLPVADAMGGARLPLVLSAGTWSGYSMAERGAPFAHVLRAPLDLRWCASRAVARLRPRLLVLETLELWPNLVWRCLSRGIRVVVLNGRMSPRSLRWYRRFGALFRPCFSSLSRVYALTEPDAARFVEAGVVEKRVTVCSSSKDAALEVVPESSQRPLLVLGSVHLDELDAVLPCIPSLLRQFPQLRVIVAPRHPSEAGRLMQRLAALGVEGRLHSAGGARVTVLDTMGDLARLYRGAAVALVGGSFSPRGGHSLLEPAAAGAAVVAGPSVQNCANDMVQLQRAGGALQLDQRELGEALRQLLTDPGRTATMGQAARRVALLRRQRAASLVEQLVGLAGEAPS